MDASLAAFILGVINLALLGLFVVSWRRGRAFRREMQAFREAEIMSQLDRLAGAMRERRDQLKKLKEQVEALKDGFCENRDRLDRLTERVAGVEALLVSTVGQETEDFCRQMDAIMDRMDEAKPEPEPETAPKLTLSEKHRGRYGKKGMKQ